MTGHIAHTQTFLREVGWLRRHVYFEGEFHDVWLGEMLRGEG